MTLNMANLFFTPQAGTGASLPAGQSPVLGAGGLFATPSGVGGANFMDMIFAQLLQETDSENAGQNGDGQGLKNDKNKNIISLLTPSDAGKNLQGEKFQRVQLNQILHKIAHEISATLPNTVGTTDTTEETATTQSEILAALQAALNQAPGTEGIELSDTQSDSLPPAVEDGAPSIPEETRHDFMAFLNSLLQGIPEENKPIVLKIAPGLLRKAVNNLEFKPSELPTKSQGIAGTDTTQPDGGEITPPAPALIATGLTPESLTKFIEELSQRVQQGESFIIGVVKIMPPQAKREVIFLPRALVLSGQGLQSAVSSDSSAIKIEAVIEADAELPLPAAFPELTDATDEFTAIAPNTTETKKTHKHESPLLTLLAALQAEQPVLQSTPSAQIKTNEGENGQTSTHALAQDNDVTQGSATDNHRAPLISNEILARLNALVTGGELPALTATGMPEETGFARVLKVLEEAQQRAAQKGNNAPGLEKALNVIKSMSPGLSTYHGQGAFPIMGMAFASALADQIFPEGWDWSRFDSATGQPMTLNSPAMMATSLVNQASHASVPHPATQIIAATIAKSAATGENRNITIRLEPPELGRVEIRMEFGKDRALKTHIIVEKQETYLMLQRDAHILDKSLQDSGLDTDGGTSFELAQDGNAFDDGRNNNQRGTSGGGDSETGTENAEEIIEATMDWYVDPDTGAMRYDILA